MNWSTKKRMAYIFAGVVVFAIAAMLWFYAPVKLLSTSADSVASIHLFIAPAAFK